ncbi:MAG TPA: response regulator transcription factor [Pyrinomonadaceae bacterium]|nr:response regulator transcription factor [Pyrinomonadaceae bacterium]
MDLRVAVIEDNPTYRHSLETLLSHTPGFTLAGSYGSADAALDEADKTSRWGNDSQWNVVLMDLELPGTGGIEATRRLKRQSPNLAIVILTVFEEPTTILEAISAGADGYLLKKSSANELLSQLRAIASGGSPLTAGVASTLLGFIRATSQNSDNKPISPGKLKLTGREHEVLQCLVRGQSYKQCADSLNISLDTVRTHIRGVYKKLQVHSVAEAVARAIREKLV